MKKLLAVAFVLLLTACQPNTTAVKATQQNTYTPSFVVDYQKCGTDPSISGSAVTFGTGSTCAAGRVIATQAYKNITQITATIDLSKMSQNFVNASFYMISNPNNPSTQPTGSNYCDAGGNNTQWNCREIDMLETNGNKTYCYQWLTQHGWHY